MYFVGIDDVSTYVDCHTIFYGLNPLGKRIQSIGWIVHIWVRNLGSHAYVILLNGKLSYLYVFVCIFPSNFLM